MEQKKFPPLLEAEFRADFFEKSLGSMRYGIAMGFALYALFGILDIWIVPETKEKIWFIRYALICPVLVLVYASTFTNIFRRHSQKIMGGLSVYVGFGIIAMIAISKRSELGFQYYYSGLVLVLMWIFLTLRLHFRLALFSSLVNIAGYEAVVIFVQKLNFMDPSDKDFTVFVNNNFFFLAANLLGALGAFGIERLMRTDFLQRKSILAEKEKNERMHRQFLQTAKLASIGEFAAGMAHEINNPLAVVTMYIDLLKSSFNQNPALEGQLPPRFIASTESAMLRIKRIVDGLRIFARKDSLLVEDVSLHDVIQESISLLEPIYRRSGIRIEAQLEATRFIFRGNIGRFQQVLMNLFSNARDALEDIPAATIRITTVNDGDQLVLRFFDNGCGIDDKWKSRIFDPFFTTKKAGKGTGLGMGIIVSILEEIGGQIELDSTAGQGTVATIRVNTSAGKQHAPLLPAEDPIKSMQGRVLVVDSDEDVCFYLGTVLERMGFTVSQASDGLEALEKIRIGNFDLVVTGLRMPNLSGEALCREIAQMNTSLPKVVVITGGILEKQDPITSLIHGYILKPFDPRIIHQVLRRVLLGG